MATKRNNAVETSSGVDKLELFLQRYFKHILIFIGAILILTVIIYGSYTYMNYQQAKRSNVVGEAEGTIRDNASVQSYAEFAKSHSYLSDYIHLNSAIAYSTLDNNAEAVKELQQVKGKYEEFAAGMLSDLGNSVDSAKYLQTSDMKPVWYYREIIKADKTKQATLMAEFRSKYPTSKLLEMLETWGI